MHNPEWLELIPFYIGQQLSTADKLRLESHLATCDLCQLELKEWRLLASVVQQEGARWANNLPPLRLIAPVEVALNQPTLEGRRPNGFHQAEEPTYINISINVHPTAASIPRSRWSLTMVAAAIVMVVFGGVLVYLLSQTGGRQNTNKVGLAPQANTPQPSPSITLFGGENTETETLTPLSTRPPQSGIPIYTPQLIAPSSSFCNVYNIIGQPIGIYPWPDLAYSPIGTMQPDVVYHTWIYSSNGWYQLFLPDGILGWVRGDFVRIDGNCADLTLPSPTAPAVIPPSYTPSPDTFCVLDGDAIPLHLLPGSSYDVMAVVRGPITALARHENNWYFVSVMIGGVIWDGWVSAWDVIASGICDSLPVENPLPTPLSSATLQP